MLTYLISDLHLSPEHQDGTALFEQFMHEDARDADALYVLGDLFEAWVGDDDDDDYVVRMINVFRSFSDAGKALFFQRGNRDFLLGERFAQRSKGQLLPDEIVVELAGQPTLLLHGDQLCTDDTAYQQFRNMVRSPAWQQALLSKPLAERKAIAAEMRRKSRESQQNKAEYIMDINQNTLMEMMRKHQVQHCLHGHTHRPAEHVFTLDGQSAVRWVLGDWHDSAIIMRVDDRSADGPFLLQSLKLNAR